MKPFVVDANVMNYFQKERIKEQPSAAHAAIDAIFETSWIALDDGGHCQQEWIECAGGQYPLALEDWISDCLVERKIRLHGMTKANIYKPLTNIGIPQKDHKWVKLAIGAEAANIVTEDIDLIDPARKNADSMTKDDIKKSCKGPVSKFLKKEFGIVVCCCHNVPKICVGNNG